MESALRLQWSYRWQPRCQWLVLTDLGEAPFLWQIGEVIAGWFYTYPSEKYQSVGMIIPNIWKNKKCSKPPTSYGKSVKLLAHRSKNCWVSLGLTLSPFPNWSRAHGDDFAPKASVFWGSQQGIFHAPIRRPVSSSSHVFLVKPSPWVVDHGLENVNHIKTTYIQWGSKLTYSS